MAKYSELGRVGLLFLVLALVLVLTLSVAPMAMARAEAADPGGGEVIDNLEDYITPDQFATFAGQVAFVLLLAQFLKLPIDGLFSGHVKTQYVVYVFAFGGQVLARLLLPAAGGLSWAALPTMLLYAVAVAWTANKTYVQLIAKVEAAKAAKAVEAAAAQPDTKPPSASAV
jgi:hypothetical protein